MRATSSDITVITVAYNSFDMLPGMVETLPTGTPLIIVDNGPDDGLRDWALAEGHKLIVNPRNLGFGSGCNIGASCATTQLLLFLNPDARLRPGSIQALLDASYRFPKAAAFGSALAGPDGRISYKCRTRLSSKAGNSGKAVPSYDKVVPALSGAAMMVRRAAFDAVNGFDPNIFLYYEDDDLSLRLSASQGPLLFVPSSVVTHYSGMSSSPSAALSRFKGYHWARSRIYASAKHGATFPYLSGWVGAVWHLISPRSWRSHNRRNEALGHLRGVFDMLTGRPLKIKY